MAFLYLYPYFVLLCIFQKTNSIPTVTELLKHTNNNGSVGKTIINTEYKYVMFQCGNTYAESNDIYTPNNTDYTSAKLNKWGFDDWLFLPAPKGDLVAVGAGRYDRYVIQMNQNIPAFTIFGGLSYKLVNTNSIELIMNTTYIYGGLYNGTIMRTDISMNMSFQIKASGVTGWIRMVRQRKKTFDVVFSVDGSGIIYSSLPSDFQNSMISYNCGKYMDVVVPDWKVEGIVIIGWTRLPTDNNIHKLRFDGLNNAILHSHVPFGSPFNLSLLFSVPESRWLIAIYSRNVFMIGADDITIQYNGAYMNMPAVLFSVTRDLIKNSTGVHHFTVPTALQQVIVLSVNTGSEESCSLGEYYHEEYKTCLLPLSIPDTYGADASTLKTKKCTDPYCLVCQQDYARCQRCNPLSNYKYLYDQDYSCYDTFSMPSRYGADHLLMKVVRCNGPSCIDCRENFSICTACDQSDDNRYLDVSLGVCFGRSTFPERKGPDLSTNLTATCRDAECLVCSDDVETCSRCSSLPTPYYLLESNHTCLNTTSMPKGIGPDFSNNTCQPCDEYRCENCSTDKKVCLKEMVNDQNISIGFYDTQIQVRDGDYVVEVGVSGGFAVEKESKTEEFWSRLASSVKVKIGVVSLSERPEKVEVKWEFVRSEALKINAVIYFQTTPMQDTYQITISTINGSYFDTKHFRFFIVQNETIFPWKNPVSSTELKIAGKAGEFMGYMGGGEVGESETAEVGTLIGFTLMASDPSGVFTRFSQSLKMMSKYIYLNAKQGQLLRSCLEKIEEKTGTFKEESASIEYISSKGNRGKLTKYRILLNPFTKLFNKIMLYLSSWTLKLVIKAASLMRLRVWKFVLILMYFIPKVHLIIFNMILVDFTFYLPRGSLHSNNLSVWGPCWLILLLISIDFIAIYQSIMDRYTWNMIYKTRVRFEIASLLVKAASKSMDKKETSTKEKWETELKKAAVVLGSILGLVFKNISENESNSTPLNLESNEPKEPKKNEVSSEISIRPLRFYFRNQLTKKALKKVEHLYDTLEHPPSENPLKNPSKTQPTKIIDYPSTYKKIQANSHLTSILAAHIKPSIPPSRISFASRLNFFMHACTITFTHTTLISTQTPPSFVSLFLLFSMSVARSITSVISRQQYQYRVTTIHHISHSSLSCLVVVVHILSTYVVQDLKYTDVSIICILMLIGVIEYVVVVVYSGIRTYSWIVYMKGKKNMKRVVQCDDVVEYVCGVIGCEVGKDRGIVEYRDKDETKGEDKGKKEGGGRVEKEKNGEKDQLDLNDSNSREVLNGGLDMRRGKKGRVRPL